MKKRIGIILACTIILNSMCMTVFADNSAPSVSVVQAAGQNTAQNEKASQQESLEKAIKTAKAKITIPPEYTEFTSNLNNSGNKTIWRLSWSTKQDGTAEFEGNISISVDEKGNITEYSTYKYIRNTDYHRKLPEISKAQAIEASKRFIYYMCPEISTQIDFDTYASNSVDYEGNYQFTFYRQYKGIPFYENSINVSINGKTGEAVSFYRNWTDDVQFPDATEAMSMDKAQKAYEKNLGLILKYRGINGETDAKTYLEYSPRSTDTNMALDAVTGEVVPDSSVYSLPYGAFNQRAGLTGSTTQEVRLSDAETAEVNRMESLMTSEAAEKSARGIKELGITTEYKLMSYYINRYGSDEYTIQMNFAKPFSKEDLPADMPQEKINVMIAAGEMGGYVNVTLNAKTGELVSSNSYGIMGNNTGNSKYKRDDLKKIADDFLSKYKKNKSLNAELQAYTALTDEMAKKYGYPLSGNENSFTYVRTVNGIPFEDNSIMIDFDPATGLIRNYNENWSENADFISTYGIISLERAYDALYKNSGLQLKYTLSRDMNEILAGKTGVETPAPKVKLVYALDYTKPACIDAKSGVLINSYNNEPFKAASTVLPDIENHYAKEQIEALLDAGIITSLGNFRPDEAILQKDLLLLISKASGNYGSSSIENISQKELDGFYRNIITDGILNAEERNPDGTVTREQAVKYMLNFIGYKKFADMDGIFNCTFSDKAAIDPKLVGYATIAGYMGIVDADGTAFNPKKTVTRAEAAVMIYNLMRR